MANLFDIAVAQALAGSGGGGGGDLDYDKAEITLTTRGGDASYVGRFSVIPFEMEDPTTYTAFYFNDDGSATSDTIGPRVYYGTPYSAEIYIKQNKYIMASSGSSDGSDFQVTGDAEIMEIPGAGVSVVKIYGDCSISLVGNPSD